MGSLKNAAVTAGVVVVVLFLVAKFAPESLKAQVRI